MKKSDVFAYAFIVFQILSFISLIAYAYYNNLKK